MAVAKGQLALGGALLIGAVVMGVVAWRSMTAQASDLARKQLCRQIDEDYQRAKEACGLLDMNTRWCHKGADEAYRQARVAHCVTARLGKRLTVLELFRAGKR